MAAVEDTSMYGLLTKREVKMAGYWQSSFFACLWTETNDRTSLGNKGLLYAIIVGQSPYPEWAR